jgi:co-chaperonin GroES (HSP10)
MQPKTLALNKIPRIGPRSDSKVKTELGEYDIIGWNGKNESGYRPVGDRVLVMPDQASNDGLIRLPDDVVERIALAAETGVIVSLGDEAFKWNSDRSRQFEGEKPAVGTRVYFERYAGGKVLGRDGKWYRCLDDKCIGCVAE